MAKVEESKVVDRPKFSENNPFLKMKKMLSQTNTENQSFGPENEWNGTYARGRNGGKYNY